MSESFKKVSIVIPLYNEQETLEELHAGILAEIENLNMNHEIIFVDDGSRDGSLSVIERLCASDENTRCISFAGNYGKAAALDAGFQHCRGDVVVTMDADMQDDPGEIRRFIDKLSEGYDMVSGWKKARQDPWHKTMPSKFFNFVVAKTFKIHLHDFNCGFKAYRRELLDNITLYGELHRYIPVLANAHGARITEIEVHHHPRLHGVSKYGIERLPKGFLDLLTILLTTRYLKRPMHVFGGLGLMGFFLGSAILFYLVVLWFSGDRPIGNRPLFFFGMLFSILGVQFFLLGMLGELIIKYNHKHEPPAIKRVLNFHQK